MLRIDAVKSLQQRWQAEAQAVPLDRKQEQKLWDAFRKPIDDAFNRKTQEREKAAAALSERDRAVLEASKALEAANASGDAQKIKAAMAALEPRCAARRRQAAAAAAAAPAPQCTGGRRRRCAAEAAPAEAPPRRRKRDAARPRPQPRRARPRRPSRAEAAWSRCAATTGPA